MQRFFWGLSGGCWALGGGVVWVVGSVKKMGCFGDFVANLAKGGVGDKGAENQGRKAYTSFIVRLSFVISSINVRDGWGVLGGGLGVKWIDY